MNAQALEALIAEPVQAFAVFAELRNFTHAADELHIAMPSLHRKINNAINNLPVFGDYDAERVPRISNMVFELLEPEDGLEALFGLIREALPARLNETAYALACDVAAADGLIREGELRLLEEIRYELELDRLHAAAIERGARARHLT